MEIQTKAEHVITLDNDEMTKLSEVLDFITKCEENGTFRQAANNPESEDWRFVHHFARTVKARVLL